MMKCVMAAAKPTDVERLGVIVVMRNNIGPLAANFAGLRNKRAVQAGGRNLDGRRSPKGRIAAIDSAALSLISLLST